MKHNEQLARSVPQVTALNWQSARLEMLAIRVPSHSQHLCIASALVVFGTRQLDAGVLACALLVLPSWVVFAMRPCSKGRTDHPFGIVLLLRLMSRMKRCIEKIENNI